MHDPSTSHDPGAASDIPTVTEIPTPILLDEAPRPRGHPLLAWLAILLLVGVTTFLAAERPMSKASENKDRIALVVMQMQARYLVGVASLVGHKDPKFSGQAQALNVGTVPQRLRFAVLAGELAGPAEARKELQNLDHLIAQTGTQLTPTEAAVKRALDDLYRDYEQRLTLSTLAASTVGWMGSPSAQGPFLALPALLTERSLPSAAPSLSDSQCELLRHELGWFGDLALAPEGGPNPEERAQLLAQARRTMFTAFGAFTASGLLGLAGLLGLILLLVLLFTRRVRSRLTGPSGHGAIYAETFAVYMALFFLFSILFGFVAVRPAFREWRLLLSGAAALLSLTALAWPVLRGVPWRQVRQDVGLTLGRSPALEPLLGVATYAMALPLAVVGLLLTLFLMKLQNALQGGNPADSLAPPNAPSHPVVEVLASPGWSLPLQVVFLAAVVAPVVEEIMFRGVLYRHLRDATGRRFGITLSAVFSATLVSFVFAVIHPQGLVAVPALMALAYAFTLAREWRGTLVPAMVAHGLNNAVITLLSIVTLSG
jgi:membrane protease YdiL (CAAX protease family)